jgi:hypothetical protein
MRLEQDRPDRAFEYVVADPVARAVRRTERPVVDEIGDSQRPDAPLQFGRRRLLVDQGDAGRGFEVQSATSRCQVIDENIVCCRLVAAGQRCRRKRDGLGEDVGDR